jgi:serine/threonine protein kinase
MIEPLTLKTTLIDFGLSEMVAEECDATQRDSGSYEYLAPEKILDSSNYLYGGKEGHFSGYKADVWGMGVILYAMLYAQFPWSKSERRQFIKDHGKHPDLKFPEKYDWVSKDAKDLLLKVLSFDFEKRPNVEEVLTHPWLKERRQTFPFASKSPLRITKSK